VALGLPKFMILTPGSSLRRKLVLPDP